LPRTLGAVEVAGRRCLVWSNWPLVYLFADGGDALAGVADEGVSRAVGEFLRAEVNAADEGDAR
jgi:hypothetical protein